MFFGISVTASGGWDGVFAWLSIAVNIFLSLLNLAIAAASGSLAVAAEMVHNLVDLVASVAVLAGVKISERESRAFPYGLYKVENVVAVGVAILIFVSGYEIAKEAIFAEPEATTVNGWMLAGVALSAVIPLAFSVYEMRVGRKLNSPSLMADAQEYRAKLEVVANNLEDAANYIKEKVRDSYDYLNTVNNSTH